MKELFIYVYGTSDGYKLLRSVPNKNIDELINDSRYDKRSGGSAQEGTSVYSVKIRENYICYSKTIIVNDTISDDRLGFLCLTVAVNIGSSVKNIKGILDNCFEIYQSSFISEYFGLIDKREAHKFDEDIIEIIEKAEIFKTEKYIFNVRNENNAAYIYVPKDKISEYFKYENIFQEEYKDYREIYFIDPSEKDNPSSILNALKHDPNADLTHKINLDNPDYTIAIEKEEGITLNGIQEGTKVKLNEKAGFGFSKKHYKTEKPNYSGSWKELLTKYKEVVYLSKEFANTIVIKSPKFEQEVKEIKLIFKCNGKEISVQKLNCSILSNDKQTKKRIQSNQIRLFGEELDKNWEIKIASNKTYKAIQKTIYRQGYQIEHKIIINLEEKETPLFKKMAQFLHKNSDAFLKMTIVLALFLFLISLVYLGYRFWPFGEEETIIEKTPENTEEIVKEGHRETIVIADSTSQVNKDTSNTDNPEQTEEKLGEYNENELDDTSNGNTTAQDTDGQSTVLGSNNASVDTKKYSDKAFIKAFQNSNVNSDSLTEKQKKIYNDYYEKIKDDSDFKGLKIQDLNELKKEITKILEHKENE